MSATVNGTESKATGCSYVSKVGFVREVREVRDVRDVSAVAVGGLDDDGWGAGSESCMELRPKQLGVVMLARLDL